MVAEGFLEPASLCGSFKHGLELRLIDLFLQAPLHLARMKTRGRSLTGVVAMGGLKALRLGFLAKPDRETTPRHAKGSRHQNYR